MWGESIGEALDWVEHLGRLAALLGAEREEERSRFAEARGRLTLAEREARGLAVADVEAVEEGALAGSGARPLRPRRRAAARRLPHRRRIGGLGVAAPRAVPRRPVRRGGAPHALPRGRGLRRAAARLGHRRPGGPGAGALPGHLGPARVGALPDAGRAGGTPLARRSWRGSGRASRRGPRDPISAPASTRSRRQPSTSPTGPSTSRSCTARRAPARPPCSSR